MITYLRKPHHQNPDIWLYCKKGGFGNISRNAMPPIVLRHFDETGANNIDFDDKPTLPRCLFCEAPQSHRRLFQREMVALCDDHYYTENIGRIAARLRKVKKEQGDYGILTKKSTTSQQKGKSKPSKSKK